MATMLIGDEEWTPHMLPRAMVCMATAPLRGSTRYAAWDASAALEARECRLAGNVCIANMRFTYVNTGKGLVFAAPASGRPFTGL